MSPEGDLSKRTTRRIFNIESGRNIPLLEGLATYDELNLRRLWLLAQYQHAFRSEATFSDSRQSLLATFMEMNKITGTYWKVPNRRQILGRRREIKVKRFLEFWEWVADEEGTDIFEYALRADPKDLIFQGAEAFVPLVQCTLKLPMEEWREIQEAVKENRKANTEISLPYELEARFNSMIRAFWQGGDESDDVPF